MQSFLAVEGESLRENESKALRTTDENMGEGFDAKTLCENFEAIAEANGGLGQLRKLVLQHALTRGFEGDSASRWVSGKVGDFVTFLNGYAFKSDWFVQSGVRLLRNANVSHGNVDWAVVARVSEERAKEFARFSLTSGDIVLSLDRPIISTGVKVARLTPSDVPCLLLQRVAKASGRDGLVDPSYLFTWFTSPLFTEMIDPGRSNGVPHISTKEVQGLAMILPPLAEQKRIVAKVDQLMALCDELEAGQTKKRETGTRLTKSALEALTNAEGPEEFNTAWIRVVENFDLLLDSPKKVDELKQCILALAAAGRLCQSSESEGATVTPEAPSCAPAFAVPSVWSWSTLGRLCRFIDYRGRTPTKTSSGVRLITAKNVRMGALKNEPQEYIAETEYDKWMTRGIPRLGDVLFTTEAPLGNVAQLTTTDKVALAQRIITLQPADLLNPQYLMVTLMSPQVQSLIRSQATGMTALGIKAAKLKLIPFPIPSLNEQARIVERVQSLMTICDSLQAKLRLQDDRASKLVESIVQEIVA